MHFSIQSCTQCQNPLETRILGLCSGLGPPTVRCSKCGLVNTLVRKEWRDFSALDVARYLTISVLAIAGFALVGAIVGCLSYPIPDVPWGKRPVDATNPGFVPGAVVFSLLALSLQLYRIASSRSCNAPSQLVPFPQSWHQLQTNLQAKACLFAIAAAFAGS